MPGEGPLTGLTHQRLRRLAMNWSPVTAHSQPRKVPRSSQPAGKQKHSKPSVVAAARREFVLEGGPPERPPGIPVQLVNEPSPEEVSEPSLRTVRCASDCLSRDSMAGVVMKATAALVLSDNGRQMKQQRLLQRHSQQAQRQPILEREIPVDKSANNSDTAVRKPRQLPPAAVQQQRIPDDASQSQDKVSFPEGTAYRNCILDAKRAQTISDFDFSALMQSLIGHVYGTDCQRVSNSRQTFDANQADEASKSTSVCQQGFDDWSEMMTLTYGDLSQTLLTQMCRRLHGSSNQAGVTSAAAIVEKERESTSCQHSKNGNSSLSLVGSELDHTLAATALCAQRHTSVVQAMPPSNRLGKADTGQNDGDKDSNLTICSTKMNDITVESKVEFDLGSFAKAADDDGCRFCNCAKTAKRRHSKQQGQKSSPTSNQSLPPSTVATESRFGHLRTPELCQQQRTRTSELDDDEASSFTAAMVEWDDQKRRTLNGRKGSGGAEDGGGKSRGGRQRKTLKKRSSSRQFRSRRY